jgi:hypothetical protein
MAVVAQVIGKNIVPSVVKNLVVRDEVDIKVIARDERVPGLQMRGETSTTEPVRMIGNDDLVGALAWDEPSLKGNSIFRWEEDVLVLEANFLGVVNDGCESPTAEVVDHGLDCGMNLFFGEGHLGL